MEILFILCWKMDWIRWLVVAYTIQFQWWKQTIDWDESLAKSQTISSQFWCRVQYTHNIEQCMCVLSCAIRIITKKQPEKLFNKERNGFLKDISLRVRANRDRTIWLLAVEFSSNSLISPFCYWRGRVWCYLVCAAKVLVFNVCMFLCTLRTKISIIIDIICHVKSNTICFKSFSFIFCQTFKFFFSFKQKIRDSKKMICIIIERNSCTKR